MQANKANDYLDDRGDKSSVIPEDVQAKKARRKERARRKYEIDRELTVFAFLTFSRVRDAPREEHRRNLTVQFVDVSVP